MERSRRIAIYGGSFDPVHEGHLAVARNLSELFDLDEVVFVPAHLAPHKRDRAVSAPLHRYAMLALATQSEERFRISAVELQAPEKPYTVETLERFREELGPSADLFFVMGADSWLEIKTWREWERVLTMTNQIVVTRPGYEIESGHVSEAIRERLVDLRGITKDDVAREIGAGGGPRIFISDAASVDLSATAIRSAVRETGTGANLSELVPPAVAEYVLKYGLYREVRERETADAGNRREH